MIFGVWRASSYPRLGPSSVQRRRALTDDVVVDDHEHDHGSRVCMRQIEIHRRFAVGVRIDRTRIAVIVSARIGGDHSAVAQLGVELRGVAQQRVDSLTLLQSAFAVIALGFGADTLKNLLSQK